MKFYLLICFFPLFFNGIEAHGQNSQDYKLLVRLKTSEHQIRAALESGNKDHAKEIRLKTRGINMEIMRGFRASWGDDVYFFYSSDYKKVKKGEFSGIFLDDQLEHDLSINPKIDNFYISYWGNSPNLGMNVITLIDQEFKETEIWTRTFGITPNNINKIQPQIAKFKLKVDKKLGKRK
jgi:hypothetical protein